MCDRFLGEGFFLPLPLSMRRPKKPILNRINILEIILSKFRGIFSSSVICGQFAKLPGSPLSCGSFSRVKLVDRTRGSFSWVKLVGHSCESLSWMEFAGNLRLHRISLRYMKKKTY